MKQALFEQESPLKFACNACELCDSKKKKCCKSYKKKGVHCKKCPKI